MGHGWSWRGVRLQILRIGEQTVDRGEGAGSNSGLSNLSIGNITETCKALATRVLSC